MLGTSYKANVNITDKGGPNNTNTRTNAGCQVWGKVGGCLLGRMVGGMSLNVREERLLMRDISSPSHPFSSPLTPTEERREGWSFREVRQ